MKTFIVSFTNAAGNAETRTVRAITAILAIQIAYNKINEVITFREIETVVCNLQEE
jgi:hypothetical protein